MPFVRFTRDKRGYEHTFVMHAARVRGRKRTRVLYWFRTPPGVRVGRAPLDAEAIRAIEDSHPDLQFDWTSMLQQRVVSETASSAPGPKRPFKRDREAARPVQRPVDGAPPPQREMDVREIDKTIDASAEPEPEALDGNVPVVPGEMRIDLEEPETTRTPVIERHPALEELVGSEGVVRLRARFAELQARIAEQPPGGVDDTLRAEADALDPDGWVTLEEARAGLETFEAGFEAVRRKLPPRPREQGRGRRRGRGGRAGEPPAQPPPIQSDGPDPAEKTEVDDGQDPSGTV